MKNRKLPLLSSLETMVLYFEIHFCGDLRNQQEQLSFESIEIAPEASSEKRIVWN